MCDRTEVFTLGESLGGVESLIEHPGRMTHASVAGTELEVPSDLIRLSVGIETADDLVADLDRPLAELGAEVRSCVDFGSTFTKAPSSTGRAPAGRRRRAPHHDRHRRPRRVRRVPGARCASTTRAPTARGAGLLVGRRRAPGRRRRQRGAGHRRGRTPGRAVQRRQGGARGRPGRRRRPAAGLLASRPDVVLLVGGTDGGNTEALLAGARMLAGARWAARSWSPATSTPGRTSRRLMAASARRTCSPTTSSPGSACSRPARAGPRSARCSWPT